MPVDCEHQLEKKKTWSGPGKQEGIFIGIVCNSWRTGFERLTKVQSPVAIHLVIYLFNYVFIARRFLRTTLGTAVRQ